VNEHSFIRAIHKKLPADLYRWKIHDSYTGGVPDTLYAGPSGILFIEYKWLKSLPKKPTTPIKIGLSPLQIIWLNKFHSFGQKVAVVVGYPDGVLLFEGNSWTKDINIANIQNYVVTDKLLVSYILSVAGVNQ
jgi:hypothetical protein